MVAGYGSAVLHGLQWNIFIWKTYLACVLLLVGALVEERSGKTYLVCVVLLVGALFKERSGKTYVEHVL